MKSTLSWWFIVWIALSVGNCAGIEGSGAHGVANFEYAIFGMRTAFIAGIVLSDSRKAGK